MELQLLIEDAVKVMQDEGFHPVYVAENKRTWEHLLEFAGKQGCTEFSTDLCDGYQALFPDSSDDNTQHSQHAAVRRCLRRLEAIHDSGNACLLPTYSSSWGMKASTQLPVSMPSRHWRTWSSR